MEHKDIQASSEHHAGHHGAWCDMHGHSSWGNTVVKILLALFIFWCGVQFGELKALVHGGGYRMMDASYGGPGMMNVRY